MSLEYRVSISVALQDIQAAAPELTGDLERAWRSIATLEHEVYRRVMRLPNVMFVAVHADPISHTRVQVTACSLPPPLEPSPEKLSHSVAQLVTQALAYRSAWVR